MSDPIRERLTSAHTATIHPFSGPVDCRLAIPGSKSLANRALLLAAAATGVSRLAALPDSDDIRAALGALAGLGVSCRPDGEYLAVIGSGGRFPNRSGEVTIGSSGTVGRFLPGLLAADNGPDGDWSLVSTPQLAKRPLAPLVEALTALGGRVSQDVPGQSFPLRVRSGGIAGGRAEVSAKSSSQFASGVLMAAPLALAPTEVTIRDLDPEERYIDLTLDLMRTFGVEADVGRLEGTLTAAFPSPLAYRSVEFAVEADFNSALYFLALPLLVGGQTTISNLPGDSRQPGTLFLDVLRRLGAEIEAGTAAVTVAAERKPLSGGFTIDMRAMSEMALTLGVLAVFADGPVTMTNLLHIRGHETDRLRVLAEFLADVGVRSDEGPDRITIHPAPRHALKPAAIDSRDDHRVVMSAALLGLAANGLTIANPGAVAKTFPGFFDLLASVGPEVTLA